MPFRGAFRTLGFLSAVSVLQAAAPLAIRGARVFDGMRTIPQANVLVRDGRIVAVGPGIAIPEGAQVIDGSGKTLLPGLIDAHAHVWMRADLKQQLIFGVTTVLDMFTAAQFAAAMRKEQTAGQAFDRADLYSAGTLLTAPGGHGTEYPIKVPTLSDPSEAQAFVDARIAEGSDYIKLILDDFSAYGGHRPTLSKETLTAAIAAAHRRGKLTVVHIGTLQEAEEAINAGADGLAHLFLGPKSDPDFGRLVASHHAFVVPTLTVLQSVCGNAGGQSLIADAHLAPYLGPSAIANLKKAFTLPIPVSCAGSFEAVKQLRAAGVAILVGDDVPNPGTSPGATEHRELELLVEAGLTPTEALIGATSAAARAFHLDDRGTIAPGMRADLLLVNGDPAGDIKATRDIAGVWKDGVAADRAGFRAAVARESDNGLVSDFEQDQPESRFGSGWIAWTDTSMGGKSTAALRIAPGGAHGSKGCLDISGTVVASGLNVLWAGAMFVPGKARMDPVDLPGKQSVSFWAKGEGRPYSVMIFAQSFGYEPAGQSFTAGPEWKQFSFPLKSFKGADGHGLMGLFVGSPTPGKFDLQIDDVRFE
jgi:imidazolonepropionase-like amidohydrolase